MVDWNDFRFFLAVSRTGSTLAAGRALRVSQTTAARRIAALEVALGLTLFERRQSGYSLTSAGDALMKHARAVEAAAGALSDAAASDAREASGTVRLTTDELYAATIVSPILRDLHAAHPKVHIEVEATFELRDLAGGGADIALRSGEALKGQGLVGRRVGYGTWAVYCSRSYERAQEGPRTIAGLRAHTLIGGGGAGIWRYYQAWLQHHDLEGAVAVQQDTATGMLSAVKAGFGLAALPTFIADLEPDLVKWVTTRKSDKRGLWLVTHERVRHAPRVRVVLDFLGQRLSQLAREGSARRAAADQSIEPG